MLHKTESTVFIWMKRFWLWILREPHLHSVHNEMFKNLYEFIIKNALFLLQQFLLIIFAILGDIIILIVRTLSVICHLNSIQAGLFCR